MFLLGPFVFVDLYLLEKEGGRGNEVLSEEARIPASCQKKIKYYRVVVHTRYQVADGRWKEEDR